MGKNKLFRFSENEKLPNVYQPTREEILKQYDMKGNWNKHVFKNDNPIVLELGCGKGEYSVNMAKAFPEKNFIGVDIKGARFWVGAKQAEKEGLNNVCFLRSQIEMLDFLFEKEEVSEIWITFPDPQMKFRRAKKRLMHPDFLKKYHSILKPNGLLHLKTDSEFLHGYLNGILFAENHEVLVSQHDVYGADAENIPSFVTDIETHYEKLFKDEGKKITYIQFRLNY